MQNKKEHNLVAMLRKIHEMRLSLQHVEESSFTILEATRLFLLSVKEIQVLADYFFQPEESFDQFPWSIDMESEVNLERKGYLSRGADGQFEVSKDARNAITHGDPYIIIDSNYEHQHLFERLSYLSKQYFEEDGSVKDIDFLAEICANPRSVFASRFKERFFSLPDGEGALLLVLASHFQRNGPVAWRVPKDTSDTLRTELASHLDGLIRQGIVTILAEDQDIDSRSSQVYPAMISVEACAYLFSGLDKYVNLSAIMSKTCHLVRAEDIREKALFYPRDIEQEVRRIFKAVSQERYRRLIEQLSERGHRRALTCLLYGPPGTGKTELVAQMARSSGRNVIRADIAKLTGSYVGESERNYRTLFTAYRYAAAIMSVTPILLLNEADAFFSTRMQVWHANEKYENNIQNIVLEEMESFEGILLATTNHTSNFDEAYDRRFLMKVEIGIPDAETRLHIWRNSMPDLPASQSESLAESFVLTGAQIDNVATRFTVLSVLDEREPGFDDLVELCRAEEKKVTGQNRNKIGFGSAQKAIVRPSSTD